MMKPPSSQGRTAIVVDHDPLFRRLIADTLSIANVQSSDAFDLPTVVTQVKARRPDLIVVNASPRNGDIGALVHSLRAFHTTASIPIVMLLDHGGDRNGSADHAIASVDRCVPKPFSPLALLQAVDQVLSDPLAAR